MSRRLLALAASLLSMPLAAHAQSHPLVGSWRVVMQVGSQVEDGVETAIIDTATMTVTAQGDSLVASLAMPLPPGMPPRPPRRMTAAMVPGPVTFVLKVKMLLNENGTESTRDAVSTFTFSASGDQLTGTVARRVEGMPAANGSPTPLSGRRVSS